MRRSTVWAWLGLTALGGCFLDRNGIAGDASLDAATCTTPTLETCDGRDEDCDGRVDEDFSLDDDRANCGACGRICPIDPPHGAASCSGGVCALTCDAGFADCDARASNGCEASLDGPQTCGSCDNACAGDTPFCGGDPLACRATCPPGTTPCAGSCVDLAGDPSHCGACDMPCPPPSNGAPTCTAGVCGGSCDPRYADCDRTASNGCEVDLRSDVLHCGACDTPCPPRPNAVAQCGPNGCRFGCLPNFADCDGLPDNGCEVDLRSDPAHCGACDFACPSRPNAAATCTARTCGIACEPSFADCDASPNNGCEIDLRVDAAHCGRCGNACPASANAAARCTSRTCGLACAPDFADCTSAPGCETALGTRANCGGCGDACALTSSCNGTTCIPTCSNDCDSCAHGCCSETCSDGNCMGSCGTDCACAYDCSSRSSCQYRCGAGTQCAVGCRGTDRCTLTCAGGATCLFDCREADDCPVACTDGSRCSVACASASGCRFTACTGGSGAMSCAGGVIVCNQACP